MVLKYSIILIFIFNRDASVHFITNSHDKGRMFSLRLKLGILVRARKDQARKMDWLEVVGQSWFSHWDWWN